MYGLLMGLPGCCATDLVPLPFLIPSSVAHLHCVCISPQSHQVVQLLLYKTKHLSFFGPKFGRHRPGSRCSGAEAVFLLCSGVLQPSRSIVWSRDMRCTTDSYCLCSFVYLSTPAQAYGRGHVPITC
jgi:hypothetical protein